MRVVAIVAEYNPLHNGHEYQIKKAKEEIKADYIIVLMTGNYTQRGMPAILSKYERAQFAISAGADLVLELPVCFVTEDVPEFAFVSAMIINDLSIVDYLLFSSESGSMTVLKHLASIICSEKYAVLMKEYSYFESPSKRRSKVFQLMGEDAYINEINKPNNLFGAYFIFSLQKLSSTIKPITIKRIGDSYFEFRISKNGDNKAFSSATAIRKCILDLQGESRLPEVLKQQVPTFVFERMEKLWRNQFPIERSDFWEHIVNLISFSSIPTLCKFSAINEHLKKCTKNKDSDSKKSYNVSVTHTLTQRRAAL